MVSFSQATTATRPLVRRKQLHRPVIRAAFCCEGVVSKQVNRGSLNDLADSVLDLPQLGTPSRCSAIIPAFRDCCHRKAEVCKALQPSAQVMYDGQQRGPRNGITLPTGRDMPSGVGEVALYSVQELSCNPHATRKRLADGKRCDNSSENGPQKSRVSRSVA
jgi:hypothetical protein